MEDKPSIFPKGGYFVAYLALVWLVQPASKCLTVIIKDDIWHLEIVATAILGLIVGATAVFCVVAAYLLAFRWLNTWGRSIGWIDKDGGLSRWWGALVAILIMLLWLWSLDHALHWMQSERSISPLPECFAAIGLGKTSVTIVALSVPVFALAHLFFCFKLIVRTTLLHVKRTWQQQSEQAQLLVEEDCT